MYPWTSTCPADRNRCVESTLAEVQGNLHKVLLTKCNGIPIHPEHSQKGITSKVRETSLSHLGFLVEQEQEQL